MKKISRISKSQYIKGMQCQKALWFYRNRPELMPEISENQQALFNAGYEVGELAQKCFNNGIEIIEEYYKISEAIKSTEKAISDGYETIYEATACSDDGAFSKIDILNKVCGTDSWDLIEVKMSTSVKDYHINDMALQRYAFTGAGYKIRKSILMHINNQYVRYGGLDVNMLFQLEDRTEAVTKRMEDVKDNVIRFINMINSDKEPVMEPGDHCYFPFECDYTYHCMSHIPDYSVYNIFRRGIRLNALIDKGILEINDIPDNFNSTDRQYIDIDSFKNNRIYKNKDGIAAFLNAIEYPLYFLDYETINPAVPLFDNSRPYQQIPFQYSLHVQQEKNGKTEHIEFLHTGKEDPRPTFIKSLIANCGDKGSVIVYNKAFEQRINNELAIAFQEYETALENISDRMVDLLVPFRSRLIYHPEMKSSASLKSVLPAFVKDISYDDLEIADGGTASQLFLSCVKDAVSEDEKKKIYKNLREYCSQDTLAEVRLLEVLYNSIL